MLPQQKPPLGTVAQKGLPLGAVLQQVCPELHAELPQQLALAPVAQKGCPLEAVVQQV
ncbi:hypothetical protein SBA4_1260010 [Candidatus Sulfopaludibacter sp. SbA4]|nr:hypothetical protein SBA4_1260010 [Candidatus Sulfopaludibacter sp. SbA4]